MVKRIGILTSGGDSPGMNCAIRAVVRSGLSFGLDVFGIYDGYRGLVDDEIVQMDRKSVSDIVNRGGTILRTARLPEFKLQEVREKAVSNLRKHQIEALVVIGGDGSYMGAKKLTEMGINCVGLPGTIDNDIALTDYTLGFSTAVSNCVEAIDKIRDTMEAHHRLFIVQVMGHHCGDLALLSGLASGADAIFYQGGKLTPEEVVSKARAFKTRGQRDFLVVTAENLLDVPALARRLADETGYETRYEILGHIQRGGDPVPQDRILGLTFGLKALSLLLEGKAGRAVGIRSGQVVSDDLDAVLAGHKGLSPLDLAATERILS